MLGFLHSPPAPKPKSQHYHYDIRYQTSAETGGFPGWAWWETTPTGEVHSGPLGSMSRKDRVPTVAGVRRILGLARCERQGATVSVKVFQP